MHDEYGIPQQSYDAQKRCFDRARDAYERDCAAREQAPDWENLSGTMRHLWLIYIKALAERELAVEWISTDYIPLIQS